jgi:type IV pilus assembly protein PilA
VTLLANSQVESLAPSPHYRSSSVPRQTYFPTDQKKGMAIASLVIGIIGFFTFGIVGLGAILGVVLGAVAMRKAQQNPHEYGGHGLATAGLVTNILSLVMIVPIGIVAAIAIPNLLASRRAANEGASIAVLRRIHDAQQTYQATRGNGSYGSVDQLVAEGLLETKLGRGTYAGYKFTVETYSPDPLTPASFRAVSVPISYGDTGRRSFYVDETGIIRAADNRGREATVEDPPLNSETYSTRRRSSPFDED